LGLKEIVFLVFVELTQEEARPLEHEVDRSGIKKEDGSGALRAILK
jgi:hypothetical protein